MSHTIFAIFVKTPSLSACKTRLAATIGKEKAEEFYILCLDAMKALADSLPYDYRWVVAEKEALYCPFWKNKQLRYAGDGDLGQRLYHTYSALRKQYEKVILVGADAPQLTKSYITEAVKALNHHPTVIGPAEDGGFTLLAGSIDIPKAVWTKTVYSTPDTLSQLLKRMSDYHLLVPHTDVDEEKDLKALHQEISQEATKEQIHIGNWIKQEGFA